MARIVNVIYQPHLVRYKNCDEDDNRCCAVADYKVIIETDDNRLLAASVLSESDLCDFDIQEAICKVKGRKDDPDWFYPVDICVGVEDFDSFVEGDIDQGYGAVNSLYIVIRAFRKTNHAITDNLRKELAELATEINKLLEERNVI